MGVYAVSWEERVMREANQFWFYALALSVMGVLYQLFVAENTARSSHAPKNAKKKSRKSEQPPVSVGPHTSELVRQIIVDGCDLLIPAELLDWMPTGDLVLGVTMVVSTLLTGREIWKKV